MKKIYSLIFLIITTCLMPFGMIALPSILNTHTITLYISAIAGYIGTALLLWLYILGSKSVARYFSEGYSQILEFHHLIGKFGTLLILIHPILVTISYGEAWFYSLVPNISTQFNLFVTVGRLAFYAFIIIWVTSALLRSKIKFRPWKYIHLLAYSMVPFVLLHIIENGSKYASSTITKVYFWMIVAGFAVFMVVRLYGIFNLDKKSYNITKHTRISEDTFLIQLKPAKKSIVPPKTGQFIYLKTSFLGEEHPLSVLDYKPDTGLIVLGYRVYGKFTAHLSTLKPGESLMLSDPLGDFTENITDKKISKVIYIAGGIGITPFVKRLFYEKNQREQWLFYMNRNPESSILLNELTNTLRSNLVNIFSDANGQKIDRANRGIAFRKSLTSKIDKPLAYQYFLCGPGPLMDIVELELAKLGVPKSSIFRESFNF